jgi:galactokinase
MLLAAKQQLKHAAAANELDVAGGKIRRSSSRFCLGVEHGDYNGTELFGVGTDRFIWMAFKPNGTSVFRLFSANFPEDGVVCFDADAIPPAASTPNSWARFAYGAAFILQREGYSLNHGFDAVIYGNIPGGGMSRSASLALNLIITMLEVNGVTDTDGMANVDLAQAVENDYIGSPCGKLDQIMIMFARDGMGTYYQPSTRSIDYVPLGASADDFRLVSLDTGTVRPGLEKATYAIRRRECDELAELAGGEFGFKQLAEIKTQTLYDQVIGRFQDTHPGHCQRLNYIFHAQARFYTMMDAWKAGDIETVGAIFRTDGLGLRDVYQISGPELEAMCDIARSVPGVLGERMLGGGDKGASGAIVRADAVDRLRAAVDAQYPQKCPDYADKYAMHVCKVVDGITTLPGL